MLILLAEDDEITGAKIERALVRAGHEILRVVSAEAAHEGAFSGRDFDVIVLDRMLPTGDGVDIVRELRGGGDYTPVLLLTALGSTADRVYGLNSGADDYLIKPFEMDELIARIEALARRANLPEQRNVMSVGTLSLNAIKREVRCGSEAVQLQPKEFSLLECLMRNAGQTVTRKMFLEMVWGIHFDPCTNIVDSHMSRLRTKLKYYGHDFIETIRGTGYRIRHDAQ